MVRVQSYRVICQRREFTRAVYYRISLSGAVWCDSVYFCVCAEFDNLAVLLAAFLEMVRYGKNGIIHARRFFLVREICKVIAPGR